MENRGNGFLSRLLPLLVMIHAAGCGHTGTMTHRPALQAEQTSIALVPEMIRVPAGIFKMGWDDLGDYTELVAPYPAEKNIAVTPMGPIRLVELTQYYYIGLFEITNAEYCEMLNYALAQGLLTGNFADNETVRNAQGNRQELLRLNADYEGKQCEIFFDGNRFAVKPGRERHPVVYVSWYGAAFYCNMLGQSQGLAPLYNLEDWSCTFDGEARFYGTPGYRLPTEAEWEHAARFDDDNLVYNRRMVPWESSGQKYFEESQGGNDLTYFEPLVNFKTGRGTVPVDFHEAGRSKLGLYNLGGNVSEWAQDFYAPYSYFAPYNGSDPEQNPINDTSGVYRQRRGGSWLIYANNFPLTTFRTNTNWPYTSYCDLGFRIVKVH